MAQAQAAAPKVTRVCAGLYEVRLKGYERVAKVVSYSEREGDGFTGWIASDPEAHNVYSDPLPTKREAVKSAVCFITRDW